MFPKMVGFPNKSMGFPTKNDQHLGCEMGVPPFKDTPISTWDVRLEVIVPIVIVSWFLSSI